MVTAFAHLGFVRALEFSALALAFGALHGRHRKTRFGCVCFGTDIEVPMSGPQLAISHQKPHPALCLP